MSMIEGNLGRTDYVGEDPADSPTPAQRRWSLRPPFSAPISHPSFSRVPLIPNRGRRAVIFRAVSAEPFRTVASWKGHC
jgi:hypothetical protein